MSALFAQVDWLEVGDGCVERIEPEMNGRAFQGGLSVLEDLDFICGMFKSSR